MSDLVEVGLLDDRGAALDEAGEPEALTRRRSSSSSGRKSSKCWSSRAWVSSWAIDGADERAWHRCRGRPARPSRCRRSRSRRRRAARGGATTGRSRARSGRGPARTSPVAAMLAERPPRSPRAGGPRTRVVGELDGDVARGRAGPARSETNSSMSGMTASRASGGRAWSVGGRWDRSARRRGPRARSSWGSGRSRRRAPSSPSPSRNTAKSPPSRASDRHDGDGHDPARRSPAGGAGRRRRDRPVAAGRRRAERGRRRRRRGAASRELRGVRGHGTAHATTECGRSDGRRRAVPPAGIEPAPGRF